MDELRRRDHPPSDPVGPEFLEALKKSLSEPDESKRDTLLADVLRDFAKTTSTEPSSDASNDQMESISRKVRSLDEANATLRDRLTALQADFDQSNLQLDAEKKRAFDLERLRDEQSERIKTIQVESENFDSTLEARNREIHEAQLENDQLLLKLQRAELAQADTSRLDRAVDGRRELTADVEELRAELVELRESKDAKIAELNKAISEGGVQAGGVDGVGFTEVWRELARTKPPLVSSPEAPTLQAGQRAMQVLIELLRFVDDVDQLVRPFVGKYTRDYQAIQVPWDVYAKGDGMRTVARTALHPVSGKPAGVVKVRLRGLFSWLEATLIAADVTLESVAPELHAYAMGQGGAADDPNRKVKDFLREDGHELFQQHMRQLCGRKLAEAFGHSQ